MRCPDKCIDAVGLEATHGSAHISAYDRVKQAVRSETERPHALRQAILSCRSGGVVSVIGVYGGLLDKFPAGAWMNRALTLRTGQCHVQRYMKPLLQRIERGEIDPTRIITHTLPLDEADGDNSSLWTRLRRLPSLLRLVGHRQLPGMLRGHGGTGCGYGGQGLRTTFSQLSCLFLKISKPRSASSSGRVWVMIRVGSISPRSMRCSSGFM